MRAHKIYELLGFKRKQNPKEAMGIGLKLFPIIGMSVGSKLSGSPNWVLGHDLQIVFKTIADNPGYIPPEHNTIVKYEDAIGGFGYKHLDDLSDNGYDGIKWTNLVLLFKKKIKENLEFERGKDPKETLQIGEFNLPLDGLNYIQVAKRLYRHLPRIIGKKEIPKDILQEDGHWVKYDDIIQEYILNHSEINHISHIVDIFGGNPFQVLATILYHKGFDPGDDFDDVEWWAGDYGSLREGLGFERGGTDKDIINRVFGDRPGKIMKPKSNRKTFTVFMLSKEGEYFEIGFFMRSPGSSKNGGGRKTFYFKPAPIAVFPLNNNTVLIPLSQWEQDKVRKFLPEISKRFGVNAYCGEKISENLNFERGKDPKEAMSVGLRHNATEIINILSDVPEPDYSKREYIHDILNDLKENPESQKDWDVEYRVDKDIPYLTDWRNLHAFSGGYVFYDGKYYLIPYINYNDELDEAIDFERGQNTKTALGIGNKKVQYEKMMEPWLRKVCELAKKFEFIDKTDEIEQLWKKHLGRKYTDYPDRFSKETGEKSSLIKHWERKSGSFIGKKRNTSVRLELRELGPVWNDEKHHIDDAIKYKNYYIILSDKDHSAQYPGIAWERFDTDKTLQSWTKESTWVNLINGEDTIHESLDFERGQNPKSAMGIGYFRDKNGLSIKPGDMVYVEGDLEEDDYSDFQGSVDSFHGEYVTVVDMENDYFDVEPSKLEIILDESINFERTEDPKKAIGIGLSYDSFRPGITLKLKPEIEKKIKNSQIQGPLHLLLNGNYLIITDVEDLDFDGQKEIFYDIISPNGSVVSTGKWAMGKDWVNKTFDIGLNESINFERGQDPKKALDIGLNIFEIDGMGLPNKIGKFPFNEEITIQILSKSNSYFKPPYNVLLVTKLSSEEGEKSYSLQYLAQGPGEYDYLKYKGGLYPIPNPKNRINRIKESLEFERGKDPKDSMKVGRKYIEVDLDKKMSEISYPHEEVGSHKSFPYQNGRYFQIPGKYFENDDPITYQFTLKDSKNEKNTGVLLLWGTPLWGDNHSGPFIDTLKMKFYFDTNMDDLIKKMRDDAISIIREKNAIKENVDFKRIKNPKEAMGMGLLNLDISQYSKEELEDYFIRILPLLLPNVDNFKNIISNDYHQYLDCDESDIISKFILEKSIKYGPLKIDFNPYEFYAHYIKTLNENLEFERGKDPKETLGLGLFSPKTFDNTFEAALFIFQHLPVILGTDKIPEDVVQELYRPCSHGTYSENSPSWSKISGYIIKYITLEDDKTPRDIIRAHIERELTTILEGEGYQRYNFKFNESLEFERGQDPKKALGIGNKDVQWTNEIDKIIKRFGFVRHIITTDPEAHLHDIAQWNYKDGENLIAILWRYLNIEDVEDENLYGVSIYDPMHEDGMSEIRKSDFYDQANWSKTINWHMEDLNLPKF